ncbi:MFS transporter [Salinisphaera hydrothermalis]|uniref:MFS transporter n=2 Tax=Salinisphaera hydrothermalis TaxID=563188 RepID=UPI0033411643
MARADIPEKPAAKARWLRLIPLTILVYIISFMDRTNIGFAFDGIEKSMHIPAAGAGLAGGIFFIGYLFLQIPGGHLAEHWSAKKFVGIMILVWGIMAVISGFVQSYDQLLTVRFLLGVAEGGIWPAILVMIGHWFPAEERAQAFGVWIINIPIASIITSPLSGWILSFSDWRTLFVIEGIFPFLIAAPLWWWLAADRPSDARWVSPEERDYIEAAIAEEQRNAPKAKGYRDVFKSATVWKLVLVYFLIQIGFYGLNLWMPTLIQTLTQRGFAAVGLIAALPYVAAGFGLWFNGWLADRSGRYAWHVFAAMLVASVSLVASVLVGHAFLGVSILLICLAMGGALAYDGPFWAAASTTMPAAVLGGALGLINALGNLGGFVGPYVGGYLQDASGGSFLSTAVFLAAMLLLAGLVMFSVKADRRVDRGGHRG